MRLNLHGLSDAQAWKNAGIALPAFDIAKMREHTSAHPVWVHFGAGNIFRGFIAELQQRLLEEGLAQSGIIAAETFDYDIIKKIYDPFDCMTLMVTLRASGKMDMNIIASIAQGICADSSDSKDWEKLRAIFVNPGLQMVSYTITEKGYALRNIKGELLPVVVSDMNSGPDAPKHAMSITASLLLKRFRANAQPIAVVSMDNCSHNGEKLRNSVLEIAQAWVNNGFADKEYFAWISDEKQVSFPWSMIDKITPRPAPEVEAKLKDAGVEEMSPIITSRNTYIAPFVNAEAPQYLVVEDNFPNGRPSLEKAGVYMTDRDTVNMTERMKVTTCLNPLHTALAVYGCMLGYTKIADEMSDPELHKLVELIGYKEGLPVVTDPKILDPKKFIDEVLAMSGKKYIDEIVYRYLMALGEQLGGHMRNRIGNLARGKLVRQIVAQLKIAGVEFKYFLDGDKVWTSQSRFNTDAAERVKALTWKNGDRIRTFLNNVNVKGLSKNVDMVLLEKDLRTITPSEMKKALGDTKAIMMMGELKGGIDPAGGDEHWKTARGALERIRKAYKRVDILFICASIEKAMSREIYSMFQMGDLNCVANLTDDNQLGSACEWIIKL